MTEMDDEGARAIAERDGDNAMETEIIHQLTRLSKVERVDMAEIYSPPRVTKEGQRWELKAGEAMDFTTGWDF